MKPRRFRFTIGQLLKLIAIWALVFAAIRTHTWPLVLPTGLILAVFAIERARGRSGSLGAMLAGVVTVIGCGFAYLAYLDLVRGPFSVEYPIPMEWLALVLGTIGLGWGASVSFAVHLILRVVRSCRRYGMPGEPGGPIAAVGDRNSL